MRNPNGFGSVYKLSGKRRKPFGVRKTIGWELIDKDTGETIQTIENMASIEDIPPNVKLKQLYQNIGYYKTRPEAMIALADYNKDPYSLDAATITFSEIFKRWFKEKFETAKDSSDTISKSSIKSYKAAYKQAEKLHDMKFLDIKKGHLQAVINNCPKGYSTLRNIKVLFNQLYQYAEENDIPVKNYSKFVDLNTKEPESKRKPFNKIEIQLLFNKIDINDFIDTILIMIFTGLRISELLLIENSNVNIKNRTMKGGIKTDAGKDRIIPINKKILPFITKRYDEGHKFLITDSDGNQITYNSYYSDIWKPIMEELRLDHLPHDCRHTFVTLMDNAGANKTSLKRIVGHTSKDITSKTYTHKDLDELKKAVDLI